jgi:hypothetical protein
MAIVAMPMIVAPYFTAAAGPTSHSPPPMAVASRIAPGPMTRSTLRDVNGGGAGRSAVDQGGRPPARDVPGESWLDMGTGRAL